MSDSTFENPVPACDPRRQIVLMVGLSGAGITTAMRALEDFGYESVAGLRLGLIENLINQGQVENKPLAISMETRVPDFSVLEAAALVSRLRERPDLQVRALFLECYPDVLKRRYTESRRRHPLATESVPVGEAIEYEQGLLEPLYHVVSRTIDTSHMNLMDLRSTLRNICGHPGEIGLHVHVMSFSYRRGVPGSADYVYDARFLRNPYYDPDLRKKTGQDPGVVAYIQADEKHGQFLENITSMLQIVLPAYEKDGRGDLTIAFGCTGGQHRSVYFAETVAAWLEKNTTYPVSLRHRELEAAQPR